jgi:hypothetical protein
MGRFGQGLAVAISAIAFGALAFVLLDILVISSLIEDPGTGETSGYDRYEDGWYRLAPNARVASAWGKTVYPWHTDANGFRVDHNQASASSPADTIFLGDSSTFGIGLPWEDTFVGLYERASKRAVVNAGVSSYSPTAYLWQYRRALSVGALRSSHTVIVAIDISDVQDEAAIWEYGEDHPRRRNYPTSPALVPVPATSSFRTLIASRLLGTRSIYRMFRYQIMRNPPVNEDPFDRLRSAFTWKESPAIEPARPEAPGPFKRYSYQPLGVQGGLANIRERLAAISSIAREQNSDLWILIYPWPAQLRYPSKVVDWEEFNLAMCREIQCRGVINTFPQFRSFMGGNDWYERLFVPDDVHFNAFGNKVIADAIFASVNR